jgi:putative membrane protein
VLILHLPGDLPAAATLWDFLLDWQFEPITLLPLLVVAGLYLAGKRRLARLTHQRPPGQWFFAAGYATLAVALLSPIHSFSEELFFVHMVQHVLLMSVAAPLLLLANPLSVVLWSLPSSARGAVGHALARQGWLVRILQLATRPVVAWSLFVVNLWLWHQPPAYEAALESEIIHYLQHLLFFLSSVLFWWPVIGPAPLRSRLRYPARMLYVFLAWIPNSVLGAGITFAPAVLMSFYADRPRHWGIDALTDQQLAGLLMWIPGDAIYAAAMMVLLLAILRQEDRREAASANGGQASIPILQPLGDERPARF